MPHMIPLKVKHEFVKLRGEGLTIAEARDRVGICHQSAVNLNKQFRAEIEALRRARTAAAAFDPELRQNAVALACQLLTTELSKRNDLSKASTTELISLMNQNIGLLHRLSESKKAKDDDFIADLFAAAGIPRKEENDE